MLPDPVSSGDSAKFFALMPLEKAPSGIQGFDDISDGGLPRGRSTLVTGSAGAGKSIFGLQFLINGAQRFQEAGVLLSFEESRQSIVQNAASLGFNIEELVRSKQLAVEYLQTFPNDAETIGSFNLDGLFLRLELAIDAVAARRVVIDPIETLLTRFGNSDIVRGELLRLLEWLHGRGMSSVIIGETGQQGELTRFGIEEYVSDCVIKLDHRVEDQISTRYIRLLKYRGSQHQTNEFPYIISSRGIEIAPITSVKLDYIASSERIGTGIEQLDQMLGGGLYKGSCTLISGNTGNGKTTLMASIVSAAALRGERSLLVSSEESPSQLIRDMASVGLDLQHWIDVGLLHIWAERTTSQGLEERLKQLELVLEEFQPQLVALDAIGSLIHAGNQKATNTILIREIDLVRNRGITMLMSVLTEADHEHSTVVGISSILDTWLLLKNVEADGERTRLLVVVKSRGTSHSNQMREFRLTDHGPVLEDVVIGPAGILTGSARTVYQQRMLARTARQLAEIQKKRQDLEQHVMEVEAQMATMQKQINRESSEREQAIALEQELIASQAKDLLWMEQHRGEGM